MFAKTYKILSLPILAGASLVLACSKRGRRRFAERLGDWRLPAGEYIWLHGASVGEINGLIPIIEQLRVELPGPKILVTATSPTGLDRVAEFADYTALLPLDHPYFIRRALADTRIKLFVFGEVEIWPAVLAELQKRTIPTAMVNAHISERTYLWYQRAGDLFTSRIAALDKILCADHGSVARFIALGAQRERVKFIGNTKYDRAPTVKSASESEELKREIFGCTPQNVIVLGSLRPGEEQHWFASIKMAFDQQEDSLGVIVAPRHAEKFEYFAQALARYKIAFKRRSQALEGPTNVVLLDTMGELERCYSFSNLAFIGGSLVDEGGHNPLEAANYGAAVAIGPYTRNVLEIVEELASCEAVFKVIDSSDITALVQSVCCNDARITASGARAKQVAQAQRGAVGRVVEECMSLLEQRDKTASAKWAPQTISSMPSLSANLLNPAALLYRAATTLRNKGYAAEYLQSYLAPLPVISIGNITAGGNAKTPLCQYIVRVLLQASLRPVVLLRGYGGTNRHPRLVSAIDSASVVGDEALLHLHSLGVPVVVARDRVAGAKLISEQSLGNVIVLDDGFQHRKLKRNLDIVSVYIGSREARAQFIAGKLLPAGLFREDRDPALQRADIIVLSERGPKAASQEELKNIYGLLPEDTPIFRSWVEPVGAFDLITGAELSPTPCLALSAIANPQGFYSTLESLGFEVLQQRTYPDHYHYTANDLEALTRLAGDLTIVTTEKDAIKLLPLVRAVGGVRIAVLKVNLCIEPEAEFSNQVLAVVATGIG